MENLLICQSYKLNFFGRTAFTDRKDRLFFNWSGSGFGFKFTGTSAKAYLFSTVGEEDIPSPSDRAYIGVFVDDSPFQIARFPLDKKKGWYTLAENLPFGTHTLRVIKESEVGYGRAAVSEISTDGYFEKFEYLLTEGIEFIGDSITCGYGNICPNGSSEFKTAEENFSQTYAALTGRLLNMHCSIWKRYFS